MGRLIAAIAFGMALAMGLALVSFGMWALVGALHLLGGDVGSIAAEQGLLVAFGAVTLGLLVVVVSSRAYLRTTRASARRRRTIR